MSTPDPHIWMESIEDEVDDIITEAAHEVNKLLAERTQKVLTHVREIRHLNDKISYEALWDSKLEAMHDKIEEHLNAIRNELGGPPA